jgi:hypothetical protein
MTEVVAAQVLVSAHDDGVGKPQAELGGRRAPGGGGGGGSVRGAGGLWSVACTSPTNGTRVLSADDGCCMQSGAELVNT